MKFPDYKQVKVKDLIPYARNSRTHSDQQVAQIAASIKEFGFTNPILIDEQGGIIAGHGRVLAAQRLKLEEVPAIELSHLSETQKRAYVIADNKLALNAGWDDELLRLEFDELKEVGFDLELTGFSLEEIDGLQIEEVELGLTDEDAVPEVPDEPVSKLGDVWQLGNHRLMCGDSTSIDAVDRLMDGQKALLLHADPPYGMGKEGDGVANDNLYGDKLDAFQMEWWATFRTFLEDNASAYIWGNAPDLWRLWYRGGLAESERLTFRNFITWNKYTGNVKPTVIEMMRSYCKYREDCLFFMIGEQGFSNNSDSYWEGWEPIRAYLKAERDRTGWDNAKCKELAGHSIKSGCHWFDASQWMFVTKDVYQAWQAAAKGKAFKREYEDLKREYEDLKREYENLKREFYSTRAYFDNTHENMTDVWEFERVAGEERHGHATPKPVAMMERVMRSSLPKGGICIEPFGGSGSTLMGAEKSGRICYTMELQPKYVDVIIKRWQDYTGEKAVHKETGKTYLELSNA